MNDAQHKAMLWQQHLDRIAKGEKQPRRELTDEERRAKQREYKRAWAERNRERVREYNREKQRKRRAAMTEKEKQAERERDRARHRERYASDPEYRARKLRQHKEYEAREFKRRQERLVECGRVGGPGGNVGD